jgi:predicted transcriptional regulator
MKNQTPQDIQTKSLKLDKLTINSLEAIASYKARSQHYIMKEAINQYIFREEARINFIAEAVNSAKQFNATGLHITLDEFSSWASNLDNDPNEKIPKCHK